MPEIGKPFPTFSLPNQNGQAVNLRDFRGKWLVVYFYPKDDTPGCTIQGKSFSSSKADFDAAGISVVGVSQDDVASHKDFCNKFGFKIDLLSDTEAQLMKALNIRQGEWQGMKYWERTTFVVDPEGTLRKVYEKVNPEGHEQVLLNDIKKLQQSVQGDKAMASAVKPIPDGYHSVTPYLIIKGAADAIEFYKKAFGATELFRMAGPDGKIGHAEIKIGDSPIMLSDEWPEMKYLGPKSLGGSPVSILLYVDDVDTIFNRAIAEGGREDRAIENKFYGDRAGSLTDPFGHIWHVATHVEDVSPEEMKRRASAAAAGA